VESKSRIAVIIGYVQTDDNQIGAPKKSKFGFWPRSSEPAGCRPYTGIFSENFHFWKAFPRNPHKRDEYICSGMLVLGRLP